MALEQLWPSNVYVPQTDMALERYGAEAFMAVKKLWPLLRSGPYAVMGLVVTARHLHARAVHLAVDELVDDLAVPGDPPVCWLSCQSSMPGYHGSLVCLAIMASLVCLAIMASLVCLAVMPV